MPSKTIYSLEGLELLGAGRRRRCYRLPGGTTCVKFYHALDSLPPKTKLSVKLAIRYGRFFKFSNINYREWHHHRQIKKHMPAEVVAYFPENTEAVFCAQKGWGIVQSLIQNYDGTKPQLVIDELKRLDDPQLCLALYRAAETLLKLCARHSVVFFDHGNILVQWLGPQEFRLRIADFEPTCRALVPGLTHVKFYVRCKVRRRGQRYFDFLRKILNAKADSAAFQTLIPTLPDSLWQRYAIKMGLRWIN